MGNIDVQAETSTEDIEVTQTIEEPEPIKVIEQDEAELQAMADFYLNNGYAEVYFVRDLIAKCVIAVECSPAVAGTATVERKGGDRNIFGYGGLFLTTRVRLDENQYGERMIGYESLSGNDTRLSDHERGIVPRVSSDDLTGDVAQVTPISLSPFERHKMAEATKQGQIASGREADYERYINDAGNVVERFETFEVERVR